MERHDHYDVRSGLRVTCLPAVSVPIKVQCEDGHRASAMSEKALSASMADRLAWLKAPQRWDPRYA